MPEVSHPAPTFLEAMTTVTVSHHEKTPSVDTIIAMESIQERIALAVKITATVTIRDPTPLEATITTAAIIQGQTYLGDAITRVERLVARTSLEGRIANDYAGRMKLR